MENHSPKESVLSKLNHSSADEIAKSPMLNLFQKRWSPRAFSGNPIDQTMVNAVFDSSKHSASSFNEQPWRIILSENERNSYKNIFDSMTESNRSWAQSAPLFGVVICKRSFSKTGQENKHSRYDCGAFMALASLRAVELGLFIHQMAGFDPQHVRNSFAISEEFEPITLFAMGEIGDLGEIPMEFWEREKDGSSRKDLESFLFWENWDENKAKG